MPNSYNGWPASKDPNAIGINQSWSVNGIRFPGGIKSGDVEKVFTELVKDLIKIEEPLSYDYSVSGMWGWEYRANANNPNSLSCHSSGTCIDYNAVKHVNGGAPYNGWSQDAISKVKSLLAGKYQGKISWLADQQTPDPMHFEVHTDAAGMKSLAASLGDGNGGDDDMALSDDDKKWIKDTVNSVVDDRIKTHFGSQAVQNPNAALNAGVMNRINATDNKKFAGVDGYKSVT